MKFSKSFKHRIRADRVDPYSFAVVE